ncbi:MAG3090 family protein [Mycoplasmopsis adleri]|uniref:MAG3090 family protein n=1 Tax=Mycoplasmopsis adleri TaxID=51362 RepID=UPI00387307E4
MKKVGIFYDENSTYPWVLKHPKMETIIGKFKSPVDAFNWFLSFNIEALILLSNKDKVQTGQIAYVKDEEHTKQWYCYASATGFDYDVTYLSICKEFNIDPIEKVKKESLKELKDLAKDLIFEYDNDPKKYFVPKYNIIKKINFDDYLNNEAKTRILELELRKMMTNDTIVKTQINTANNEAYKVTTKTKITINGSKEAEDYLKEENKKIKSDDKIQKAKIEPQVETKKPEVEINKENATSQINSQNNVLVNTQPIPEPKKEDEIINDIDYHQTDLKTTVNDEHKDTTKPIEIDFVDEENNELDNIYNFYNNESLNEQNNPNKKHKKKKAKLSGIAIFAVILFTLIIIGSIFMLTWWLLELYDVIDIVTWM